MKRFIFFLFIFTNAYGQNFIEDVSKIQHKIAENEVELFLKKPTSDGLPEIYLNALMPVEGFNPYLMCPIDRYSYKPQEMKDRVLIGSETITTEPTEIKETSVISQRLDVEEE